MTLKEGSVLEPGDFVLVGCCCVLHLGGIADGGVWGWVVGFVGGLELLAGLGGDVGLGETTAQASLTGLAAMAEWLHIEMGFSVGGR